jgi:hypothetical protein
MAEDKLGKTVRIDDKRYDPKGAKLEVWTKGRHKYLIHYLEKGTNVPTSTIRYIDGDKISASLTDDEVIKAWQSEAETAAKLIPSIKVYKVIQDPYSDEPITKRVYGDGKSFYYLNNGCSISIEWRGDKPNPDFVLGTFSNPDDAERYYRKKDTNGVRNGPDRYLKDTKENPVIITSSVDDADDKSKLPTSSWVIAEPFIKGIDINSQPEMSEPNYRDESRVSNKIVTVNMPSGFTENGGKGYLVWTNHGLQYDTKALPNGTNYEKDVLVDPEGNIVSQEKYDSLELDDLRKLRPVTLVTKGDIIRYFGSNEKDSDITKVVIEKFKVMVSQLHGIPSSDYDLKLCSPDSEACKLIEYKSPLEAPNNSPQQAAINDTPPGPSHSSTKIKLSIQGLFESEDGTTPGSTSSVFEIKAKTDMPTFTIWTGEIPKTEEIDVFDDLPELDPEYTETDFQGDGENINTFEEIELNTQEANSSTVNSTNSSPQGTPPQGNYSVENIEPDTPFDASKLPIPPGFNGVPLYFQYDNRWANYNYGVGKKMTCSGKGAGTILSSGCMPSSLSMIINYWAKKGYCKPTRPDIVGQFCVDYGGRVCGNGGNLLLIPANKFKEVFGLNIVAFGNIGDDKVRTLLKKGFPVNHGGATTGKTAKGSSKSYGGHYLVMTGIDDQGRIRVNDSGNGPMGGKAITYYNSDKWSGSNTRATSQSYLYPDALGDPLR